MNVPVSNPNDHKVVTFHNSTDIDFTPEMGCMFDGRAVNNPRGKGPGIDAGSSITLPYHIGHRIATNLAKMVMVRKAPTIDPAGIPTGVPIWSAERLEELKNSFITDLYSEEKPTALSETDKLLAKVEELNRWKEKMENSASSTAQVAPVVAPAVATAPEATNVAPATTDAEPAPVSEKKTYADKQEVIAELEKRGIKHDKRKSKEELEKLLMP